MMLFFGMGLLLQGCGGEASQGAPPSSLPSGPTAPGMLAAVPVTSTQIELSWSLTTDASAVTGYQLDRCQGASCTTFILIASPTTTNYNDTGLTAASIYSYRVRAVDAGGRVSADSTVVTATTPVAQLMTLAIDTFNRPDSMDLGPNWDAGYTGHQNAQIVSDAIEYRDEFSDAESHRVLQCDRYTERPILRSHLYKVSGG